MSQDPRYLRKGPVGFLTLFFELRGTIACGLAVLALVVHGALAWSNYQVDSFNSQARQATAKVTRIVGDEALVTYDIPQGSFAQRIGSFGLEQGQSVRIYYTPDAPAEIRRALRRDMPLMGWFAGFATLCGIAALWIGYRQGIRTVRAIQARRYGTLETVEVTRIEEGNPGKHGGPPPARLHWKRSDGTFGKSRWHNINHVARWNSGEATQVYVWRDQVHWLDDLGPRPIRRSPIPRVVSSGQDASGH